MLILSLTGPRCIRTVPFVYIRNLKWSKFGIVKLTEDPFSFNINLIIDLVIIVYSVSIFT